MDFNITHTTTYRYPSPVSVCHNLVTLCPLESAKQRRVKYQLKIRPRPGKTEQRTDMFGNVIDRFSLEDSHGSLSITAVSRVTVSASPALAVNTGATCAQVLTSLADRSDPNWLDVILFTYDSPRIRRSPEFADFARLSVRLDQPIVGAALSLTQKIFADFKYDKDATRVDTPTETAFAGRHGVCQDFAHIAVTCLRSIGLPARYVSGYLRTLPPPGKQRLVGADQSHAWLSVYCGQAVGWVDFDPTNNCICGSDHIPVAIGRDYSDVVPIKGVFLGGGEPLLSVSVDVAPVELSPVELG